MGWHKKFNRCFKEGIHVTNNKIIYQNKINNTNIDMVESLNDIRKRIPESNKTSYYYLGNANNKSIFLKPCNAYY